MNLAGIIVIQYLGTIYSFCTETNLKCYAWNACALIKNYLAM